ncbi:unnamed protein product [Tuwongella immobilis]|uniref:MucB/RseB N-terminal domain-containing protein n=2 Tax=Tuwongella immobilis TaxID=692036 RepID=A0A6C2YW93_9BACT|nr:unnamed protein product [Tuwongella immobilis]VTS07620.1 unnamed protein product [Tuwongella immobilis]
MRAFAIVCTILVMIQNVEAGEVQDAEWNEILAEHRQSRDLLQFCSCKIALRISVTQADPSTPRVIQSTGEYWHSRDALRLKTLLDGEKLDLIWENGLERTLRSRQIDGKNQYAATISGSSRRYHDRLDVFGRALLVVNVPGTSTFLPLEDLVTEAERVEKRWSTEQNGTKQTTIRLKMKQGNGESEQWRVDVTLDSQINQLIRHVSYYYGGSSPEKSMFRRDETVEKTVELKKGVLFPTEISGSSGGGEQIGYNPKKTTISDIKLDRRFSKQDFVMRYPAGILMTDSLQGTSYKIDETGKPISKPVTLGEVPPPPSAESTRRDVLMVSQEGESSSISFIVILISIGVILVGIILRIRNR